MIPPLPDPWRPFLAQATQTPGFRTLKDFLATEATAGKRILPEPVNLFRAFELTPPDAVRVVILGQDPYPNPAHAHGLSFSVPPDVRPIPGSLRNIFKELESDLAIARPPHGCLEHWARQGVLLLNTVLTVPAGLPGGHRRKGWEEFTDAAIQAVTSRPHRVVFLLWGNDAQRKRPLIPEEPHRTVVAAHPSPLSARLFLGCRCFSTVNRHLTEAGHAPIDWSIPAPSTPGTAAQPDLFAPRSRLGAAPATPAPQA